MSADVTVREARPEDYEGLSRLTVAAYKHLLGEDMSPGYVAELADVAGRSEVADLLVAVDDTGTLVGGIAYVPGPGPLAWFGEPDLAGLRMLAVAPEAQGRGVGAALIAASVARARRAGKRGLLLHTTASMMAAQRLYQRAGFRRDLDRDQIFDGGLHLIAYALDL
ncbi:MAG TPA: GNAT family N-acetyltransferase [Acidimicrobiales bacterium]|jgi:ribosomal protein S18 acetylase RimI-like enzyme|nr:GNAT family N-acetyltransferase [Acidimicrobiales bacterium]HVE27273.1 GNAT family N-acetyltransferase [Sporichthya sp.]